MAGTKRGMPFERTGPFPIDDTLVLSKAQMLAVSDAKMPEKYFAVCTDDGKFYTYDKSATPNATTGKFSVVEGGDSHVELTQAQYNALTPEEKNNGTVYFITDAQGGGGSGSLTPATTTDLGGVIVGSGLSVESDGTLSVDGLGAPFTVDTLWEGAITLGQIGTLSHPISDYDMIQFEIGGQVNSSPDWYCSSYYTTEELIAGIPNKIWNVSTGTQDGSIKFNSETEFTWPTNAYTGTGHYIRKVYGIKFGVPELTQQDLDDIASKFPLQSYVGRWEKIGEWDLNTTGKPLNLTLDLSAYNIVALSTGHTMNQIWNSALRIPSEWEINDTLCSYTADSGGNFNIIMTKTSSNTYSITSGDNATRRHIVLYGYKEHGMTDAERLEIAQQLVIPEGGLTNQYLAKKTDADFDYEWKDPLVYISDIEVDGTTGAVTVSTVGTPASMTVKKLVGGTVIAGAWNNNVFTPTASTDILNDNWIVRID